MSTRMQRRRASLRKSVHRDVDERLRAETQIRGQRQEQHLPRGLVDRVPERRVENPGACHGARAPR